MFLARGAALDRHAGQIASRLATALSGFPGSLTRKQDYVSPSRTRADALVAEDVLEAVEPTDMAAALIRREKFPLGPAAAWRRGWIRGPGLFRVRCAVPGEESTSLLGCEPSSRQRPAVQGLPGAPPACVPGVS